ncbi:hypothetical protein SLS54_004220 [Diplodia seriata]
MSDYECDTCDRQFASQRACNQHMDALDHHDTRSKCDECPRRFNTWRACKQHMDATNHWIWKYGCETCSYRFTTQWAANEHMADKNHWSYPYDCDTCNYAFRSEDARDDHQQDKGHYKHLHCKDCDRYFQNENNLRQHRNSRVHRGAEAKCPFCTTGFTTASGVSHHLEMGSCPNARNLDRNVIHQTLRQRDPNGVFTERLLEWTEPADRNAQWDPSSAWNGVNGYTCYVCYKVFGTPAGLNAHVRSPVHQAPLYHCPNKRGTCGGRKFPTLAALFNHLESQTCNFIRFEAVQKSVNSFLSVGSARAIEFAM